MGIIYNYSKQIWVHHNRRQHSNTENRTKRQWVWIIVDGKTSIFSAGVLFSTEWEINWRHHTWVPPSFLSKSLTVSPHLNSLTATKPLKAELQNRCNYPGECVQFSVPAFIQDEQKIHSVSTSYKGGPQYDTKQKYIQKQTVISVEEEV